MYEISPTVVKFLGGEEYSYLNIPYEKLCDAPEFPGIYTWYIRVSDGNEQEILSFLDKMFSRQKLLAEVKSTIRYQYSGELHKDVDSPVENILSDDSDIALSLLRQAIVAFSYPLYIGITRVGLRSRLGQHAKALEQALASKRDWKMEDSAEPDSLEESRVFGDRIAEVFAKHGFFDTSALYVRCIPIEEYNREQIKSALLSVESFLNTHFNPIFGRR